MILVFKAYDDVKLVEALDSFKINYEIKLPESFKTFFMKHISFRSFVVGEEQVIVFFEWKLFINIMPKWFFHFMLKKGLRKYGYLGVYKRLKLSEGLELIDFVARTDIVLVS